MLTPSPKTANEIKKDVPEPIFLIELHFTAIVYLSTRGPTTWNGVSWEQAQVEMGSVQYGDNGEYSANLRIPPAYIGEALNPGIIDKQVMIGQLWGNPPHAVDDLLFLIDGVVSDVEIGESWVGIALSQPGVQGVNAPRHIYAHQNLQPAGTKVTINTRTIEIQRGDFY